MTMTITLNEPEGIVLAALESGDSYAEIARRYNCSVSKIRTIRRHAMKKVHFAERMRRKGFFVSELVSN